MNEQAVTFGESGALFGVLSIAENHLTTRPIVLIPSTGIDHRIGPGRLHVELARMLALRGYSCLRLDNAGLGDSERVPGRSANAYAPDLRAAMDLLDGHLNGAGYVIIGFGSGAHDAHQAARVDTRVVGLAFVDGYVYGTRRSWMNSALHQLGQIQPTTPMTTRPLSKLSSPHGYALHGVGNDDLRFFRVPPRRQMLGDLTDFIRRELSLYYLYTGQTQGSYTYAGQLLDGFPLLRGYPGLELRHTPELQYRYPTRQDRDALIRLLGDWVAELPARR